MAGFIWKCVVLWVKVYTLQIMMRAIILSGWVYIVKLWFCEGFVW